MGIETLVSQKMQGLSVVNKLLKDSEQDGYIYIYLSEQDQKQYQI